MEVSINQQSITIIDACPLQWVMDQRGFSSTRGIAVAVNDAVIPRNAWAEYTLQQHDKIIIIRATQGG